VEEGLTFFLLNYLIMGDLRVRCFVSGCEVYKYKYILNIKNVISSSEIIVHILCS